MSICLQRSMENCVITSLLQIFLGSQSRRSTEVSRPHSFPCLNRSTTCSSLKSWPDLGLILYISCISRLMQMHHEFRVKTYQVLESFTRFAENAGFAK